MSVRSAWCTELRVLHICYAELVLHTSLSSTTFTAWYQQSLRRNWNDLELQFAFVSNQAGFPRLRGGKKSNQPTKGVLPNGNPESLLFMKKHFINDRNISSWYWSQHFSWGVDLLDCLFLKGLSWIRRCFPKLEAQLYLCVLSWVASRPVWCMKPSLGSSSCCSVVFCHWSAAAARGKGHLHLLPVSRPAKTLVLDCSGEWDR